MPDPKPTQTSPSEGGRREKQAHSGRSDHGHSYRARRYGRTTQPISSALATTAASSTEATVSQQPTAEGDIFQKLAGPEELARAVEKARAEAEATGVDPSTKDTGLGRLQFTFDLNNPDGTPLLADDTASWMSLTVGREIVRAAFYRRAVGEERARAETEEKGPVSPWSFQKLFGDCAFPSGRYLTFTFTPLQSMPVLTEALRTVTTFRRALIMPGTLLVDLVQNAVGNLLEGRETAVTDQWELWRIEAFLTQELTDEQNRRIKELRDRQARVLKEFSEQLEARKRELTERPKNDSDRLRVTEERIDFLREPLQQHILADLTSRFEVEDTEEVKQETQDIPLLSEAEMPPRPTDGRASKVARRIKGSALPETFKTLDNKLAGLHKPILEQFQKFLDALHKEGEDDGEACPTFEENRELVRSVLELADKYGVKLFFKKTSDGRGRHTSDLHEVRLICHNPGGSTPAGVFYVRTADKNKTTLDSSPTFPRLIARRG